MRVKLKAAYDDHGPASDETGLRCLDKSLAQQHFAEECDINTIVRRFGLTGELPEGLVAPTYGDFTNVVDFRTAMSAVARARESFDELPAEWRARFHNDPAEFVDFCSDEKNRPEAERMGLVMARAGAMVAQDALSKGGEGVDRALVEPKAPEAPKAPGTVG